MSTKLFQKTSNSISLKTNSEQNPNFYKTQYKINNTSNQSLPSNGVQVKVGNKLLEMEKSEERVKTLENIINEQNLIIQKFKEGTSPYDKEITNLNNIITDLKNEEEHLRNNDTKIKNELEKLKIQLSEESRIKNEMIESNKKLQQKIEELNQQINEMKFNIKKDKEEYKNMCKVKDEFEDKIILLSDELEKNKNKLLNAENIIKQKDKYIQMLINKKNKTFYNNNNINTKSSSKVSTQRPQSSGIKKVNVSKFEKEKKSVNGGKIYGSNDPYAIILEQENMIKKLKEKISYLEKDNAGLLIRLRNNNNLKTVKK